MSRLRKLWIPGPAGKLEAAMRVACPVRAAAVVAHPHPLYGGTLHNPVVYHADRELHAAGLSTLRFNFRGVGESEGAHDDGRGEIDDVGAVVSWLRGTAPDCPLLVVGYSFGAWCSIRHAVDNPAVAGLIAIGLPVRTFAFDDLERLRRPLVVVQGSEDEFGSPDDVRETLAPTDPPAEILIVEGATHLFPGHAPDAGARVRGAAETILSSL